MEVFIVQHGDKEKERGDPGLTASGMKQAERVAARLAHIGAGALYSSPLRRARETASPISACTGLAIVIDNRLRERMNWGNEPEQTLESFLAEWRRASEERDFMPSSGDSSRHAGARFSEFLHDIAERHVDQNVVVVAHGGITVDMLRTLFGDEAVQRATPDAIASGIDSCAITRIRRVGDNFSLVIAGALACEGGIG